MNSLTKLHYKNSLKYKKLSKLLNFKISSASLKDVPFIPATLFKNFELKSISNKDTIKILTSSGTTGKPSKIFLNKENSNNQQLALSKILKNILGNLNNQSFYDIWTSQLSEMSRKTVMRGNRNFSPCDVCDVYGTLIGKNHAEAWEKHYKK